MNGGDECLRWWMWDNQNCTGVWAPTSRVWRRSHRLRFLLDSTFLYLVIKETFVRYDMGCASLWYVTKLCATISSILSWWAPLSCASSYAVYPYPLVSLFEAYLWLLNTILMFLKDWSCAPWTAVSIILGAVLIGVPFAQVHADYNTFGVWCISVKSILYS